MTTYSIGDIIKFEDKSGIIETIDEDNIVDNKKNVYNMMYTAPSIVVYNKDDSDHTLLLKGLRSCMDRFTFRIVGTVSTKQGFSGTPFFFGFTGKSDLLHYEVKSNNHLEVYPTVLYYQAGNYADLLLENGTFEFGEHYEKTTSMPSGTIMMGIVQYNENRPRFHKWMYVGNYPTCPLYLLYLLVMFGETYYVFNGLSKQEIINLLEITDKHILESKTNNKHIYQAYALICYYDEDVPVEYNLPELKQKIINNYDWIKKLHH